MKIMQAIGGAGHGGAETFFVGLAGTFHRAGLDQLLTMRKNEIRRQLLSQQNLKPIELPFGGRFDFLTKPKLQRLANEYKPDIFLSWMSRASHMTPSGNFLKLARLGGHYKGKYFEKCDHLVCITEEIRDFMADQGWSRDRLHYIPNYLSWERKSAVDRATLDTPEGVPVLLSMGRLHECKALDTALKAVSKVKDCYYWIAGSGGLEAELKALSEDLGIAERVRFLGWRTDREALMEAADICLFPSRQEAFGTVILEAWASDTPIVTAASHGPAAYIRHEENGMLSQIDNVDEIAEYLNLLINDPLLAKRLIDNGRAEFEANFTEQVAVQNWKNLFERLT